MEDVSVKEVMKTLTSQQELLQQLYRELDMEREATATAATESLSMILRLQGEKAAVEMEASQYKRMAEEKIVHTEETLESFRDLVYQKEAQIASLEFQVQSYRFKLMTLGCSDVRRGCSLPPNLFRYKEKLTTDLDVPGESSVQLMPEPKVQDHGPVKYGDYGSYWEQIRRLDESVQHLSNSKELYDSGNRLNEMIRSRSLHSQASSNSLYDATEAGEHLVEPATPAKVHDIFEVPETTNGGKVVTSPLSKQKGKLSTEDEFYPVMPDAIKAVISDDVDKKILDQRIIVSLDKATTYPKPQNELDIEQLYLKPPDATEIKFEQINRRLERLEEQRIMATQEIMHEEDDANLLLLKSIKDQLDSIDDEMKRWRPEKNTAPKKEVDLTSLAEAMLHFWL